MTAGKVRMTGVVAIAAGLVASAAVLQAGNARYPETPEGQRLLYVRSGTTARRLALSYKGLMADVYWIRTIQHFGRDLRSPRVTGRYELLEPLLDLTTSLDPHFNIAYRFGAVFLAMRPPSGAGRPDEAVALLEKGLRVSPTRWQYAYDIGFVYYLYVGDFGTAATWFTRAAAMPHAPEWIEPLAATTLAQGGERSNARRLFQELATSDQEYLRKDAVRGLAQIDALDAIDQLQGYVEAYHQSVGRYPGSWLDLIRAGRLPGIPGDDTHVPFVIDAATHQVMLGPTSSLAPLPTSLRR